EMIDINIDQSYKCLPCCVRQQLSIGNGISKENKAPPPLEKRAIFRILSVYQQKLQWRLAHEKIRFWVSQNGSAFVTYLEISR
ncbi:13632_t:CDS:1, partial [Funneliformis geosporum]